jgi:hypothetical protein
MFVQRQLHPIPMLPLIQEENFPLLEETRL